MLEAGIAEICPPTESIQREIQAFRFIYERIEDDRNFIPVYIKKPQRFNHKSDAEKCSGFGISLYNSEERAIKKYSSLINVVQNIGKTIGTHLAEGKILKDFGVTTPIDGEGHFDLHESDTCNLHNKFTVVRKIA
ncbi:MAG: Integral rane protein [Mucilaginibacter sp.]|nr:Integral rane protein [Mucilaginibacter sp.]